MRVIIHRKKVIGKENQKPIRCLTIPDDGDIYVNVARVLGWSEEDGDALWYISQEGYEYIERVE